MQTSIKNIFVLLTTILIGLISILLFVPVYPVMPRSGLDPSWILAVNEAVAQKMVFGKDILYTVGPLSSIWTQAYHPAIFTLTIIGGSIIAVGHAFLVYKIANASRWLWAWAYVLSAIFLMESRDALLLFYPLLITFLIYRVSLPSSHRGSIGLTRSDTALLMLAISSLGLLPIIKLSFVPLTLAACFSGSLMLWNSKHRVISASFFVLPVLTMILFWAISGQNIEALPDYFINNAPVISGFTQAMSVQYDFLTPAIFIISSIFVLLIFYRQLLIHVNVNGFILFLVISLFLFMSFKAGFVRHDVHALTASTGIVMVVLLLGSCHDVNYRQLAIASLTSLITWSIVHNNHSVTPFEYYKPVSHGLYAMAKEMASNDGAVFSFEEAYNAHLDYLRRVYPIPKLQGTVDIYPWEQAALIASGNKWSPRPALQSFATYTPSLAIANLDHLSGLRSPDNIVFSVNTIDGRYPSLDDGTSWPKILADYELVMTYGEQLVILSKRILPAQENAINLISSKRAKLTEIINTEEKPGIIYAEINVTSSLLGKIASILYKPTALRITVELSNGDTKHHRFISGQAITGFVLSPYIANTSDFIKLLQEHEANRSLPIVKNISINEVPFSIGMWDQDYSIKLYRVSHK